MNLKKIRNFKNMEAYEDVDPIVASHIILANFGYLLTLSNEKEIIEALKVNMYYFTDYLLKIEEVKDNVILEIIDSFKKYDFGIIEAVKSFPHNKNGLDSICLSTSSDISNMISCYNIIVLQNKSIFFNKNKHIRKIYSSFFNLYIKILKNQFNNDIHKIATLTKTSLNFFEDQIKTKAIPCYFITTDNKIL
ncbi:hypothetical protein ACOTVS_09970 [Aliarcobacter butzleri]